MVLVELVAVETHMSTALPLQAAVVVVLVIPAVVALATAAQA
jgi:hypothetical protein